MENENIVIKHIDEIDETDIALIYHEIIVTMLIEVVDDEVVLDPELQHDDEHDEQIVHHLVIDVMQQYFEAEVDDEVLIDDVIELDENEVIE